MACRSQSNIAAPCRQWAVHSLRPTRHQRSLHTSGAPVITLYPTGTSQASLHDARRGGRPGINAFRSANTVLKGPHLGQEILYDSKEVRTWLPRETGAKIRG